MDELYIQSFYQKQEVVKIDKTALPLEEEKKLHVETSEFFHQMTFYLDQLEKAVEEEFQDPLDFAPYFRKAKEMVKNKTIGDLDHLLKDLEQILELS